MRASLQLVVAAITVSIVPALADGQDSFRNGRLYFPVGEKESLAYRLRPARSLSQKEAQDWIVAIKNRCPMVAAVTKSVDPEELVSAAVASPKELDKIILSGKSDVSAVLGEVDLRKEVSVLPAVRKRVLMEDLLAFKVFRHLDPSKASLVKLYAELKSGMRTKNQAAASLLQMGDTRGVRTIRDAQRAHRDFGVDSAAGWLNSGKINYLLIQFDDGNNASKIASDMSGAHVDLRYYFPRLAGLKRSNIDRAILAKAKDSRHESRKWVAIAARTRPDSAEYRAVLKILARDPVPDVRQTALWALGKGELPRNLRGLVSN